MTVPQRTDAPFPFVPLTWKTIDWSQLRQEVRRLQMRIAKATQAGQHRKAQALQWLLTHSRAAKLMAVHRVTTNRGTKTPGVDNIIWRTDRQKIQAALNLKRHGYKPKPLRRVYILKPNGKLRPLSIPTLHDRAMQALYALALAPIAEVLADRYSYGFREGRCCADALEQCFTMLAQKNSAPWILEGDIRACFDEISHPWLLAHIPMDKQLLRAWLEAGYWEEGQLFPTKAGTPQGGLLSPILANMALDGLEQAVRAGTRQSDKVHFVRYADDFIVTGATQELLEQKVKPALTAFLQARGLALSEQKTVLTSIDKGFNFLGHTVRKYGDKLLIKPAKNKVKSLRLKVSQLIQSALGLTQEALLRQLNPLLRGWANYHRNGAAKRTFTKLDYYVGHKIWRWITRRHPDQSSNWKKQKYFSASGPEGVFSVRVPRAEGESRVLKLYRLASTIIVRHLKVRGAAHPYDPNYTEYFAKRRCIFWRIRGCSRPASLAPAAIQG
ncbi:MAG TPA: group II intron reverse transcriptase/maturase [Terriglobia bacterium]|nr:group II intron reverse transcriptase/maturase [Terriglobia bacterium]